MDIQQTGLLTTKTVLTLVAHFQKTFPFPTVILDSSWKIIGQSAHTRTNQQEAALFEILSTRTVESETQEVTHYTHLIQGTVLCHILLLSKDTSSYIPYLETLMTTTLERNHNQYAHLQMDPRSMLVNQLANTDILNSETYSLIKDLDYTPVPRYAIVLFIDYKAASSVGVDFFYLEKAFSELLKCNPLTHSQDIYGLINTEQYLIFKTLDESQGFQDNTSLHTYVQSLTEEVQNTLGVSLKITIGTFYSQFVELRQSYLEAMFLQSQFGFLILSSPTPYLTLDACIFEYFVSLVPPNQWDSLFKSLLYKTRKDQKLLETITTLSKSNTVLSTCANMLGLHRNTILHRYGKLQEVLSLHPLHFDKDRALLRAFSIHNNKRVNLNAGIIIQPNSVLHHGMRKMAAIIAEKSNGSINLNIHTLSVSGDNRLLFDILRRGSLDIAVISSSVLNDATDGRSALLELPFLFDSYDEAREVLNSQYLHNLNNSLANAGVFSLGFWTMGWRYITSKSTPIYVPTDIFKKKIRIMHNNTMAEFFRTIGTLPIQMNYGDVGKALETEVIDCQENPYTNILGMGFYKYQNYITRLKYHLSIETYLISHTRWTSLTSEQQNIIQEAMKETTDWIFSEQQLLNEQCKETLINEKGMTLVELTKEQIQLWRTYSNSLYKTAKHQDILRKIMKAKRDYHAKT